MLFLPLQKICGLFKFYFFKEKRDFLISDKASPGIITFGDVCLIGVKSGWLIKITRKMKILLLR